MACEHNQKIIDDLNSQIKDLQNDIVNLKINIEKCNDIKLKHKDFSTKLQCVVDNLEGNHVVADKKYDYGKMVLRKSDSDRTIVECGSIILESEKQITVITNTIKILEQQIANLDGNCTKCANEIVD